MYNIRELETIRELKIKDWSGYFSEEIVNILDINPECFMVSNAKECTDGTILYNHCYSDKTGVPHIVFNNIDCYFKKNGDYNVFVFFSLVFRFKTDDNLVYDEKINIPVCIISLSSVIKKDWIHCPVYKLQKCLYESFS